MRILSLTLEHFGSYDHLHIDFNKQGLTAISGPNGAGKSTICDGLAWVLYGKTAKNGSADDVIPWGNQAKTTRGTIRFSGNGASEPGRIVRSRLPNDLFYQMGEGPVVRRTTIVETQRAIVNLLGSDVDTYLSAAYFHELSPTTTFFSTTPKIRRAICEQLVDLTLAKTIQAKASDSRKALPLKDLQAKTTSLSSKIEMIQKAEENRKRNQQRWETEREAKKLDLAQKYVDFDQSQERIIKQLESKQIAYKFEIEQRIKHLNAKLEASHTCYECGAPREQTESEKRLIEKEINQVWSTRTAYLDQISREKERQNTYADQLDALDAQVNPYNEPYSDASPGLTSDYQSAKQALEALTEEHSDLTMLETVVEAYRQSAVKDTIKALERQTNAFLDEHFEAEMRVTFDLQPGEKIETTILKDGNTASYTQLSKGQRRVLNLCFGVAVMRQLAETNAFSPSVACFDEALAGMDDTMKGKAFNLLNAIATHYDTVLVVDHSEAFKTSFLRRYEVQLQNGRSVMREET